MSNCNQVPFLPKVTSSEWKFMKAAVKAWSLREASKLSGLPVTTAHRILKNFYRKGSIKFVPNLKKINLITLALMFPKLNIEYLPPFTMSIRDVYNMGHYTLVVGLVPPPLVDKYIDWFHEEPALIVKGYESIKWSPLSPLTAYNAKKETMIPIFDFHKYKKIFDYPVEKWDVGLKAPDVYDLVLFHGRLKNAFARPLKIYGEARKKDPSLPIVSQQLLSYHFNKHLKSMWAGNSALVFNNMKLVPVRLFYFEGRDAPLFARLLCQLPSAFTAAIDINKALVSAQFPCSYDEHIMCEAEGFDVEMPYPPFIQSSTDMKRVAPWLWRWIENGKWVFKEELRVPVLTRSHLASIKH